MREELEDLLKGLEKELVKEKKVLERDRKREAAAGRRRAAAEQKLALARRDEEVATRLKEIQFGAVRAKLTILERIKMKLREV